MRNIQATGQLYGQQVTVKQISKAKARKLFEQGETVYLQSCNMYPFGGWQSLCPIKYDQEEPTPDQFTYLVNSYTWYNCDSERGRYPNFYQTI